MMSIEGSLRTPARLNSVFRVCVFADAWHRYTWPLTICPRLPWPADLNVSTCVVLVLVTKRAAWTQSFSMTSTPRSEEHTSELQSLMSISYAVFCWKKKKHRSKYTEIKQ